MKRIHATRGFTLVEIAIGIVLVGMVLLAFAGMTSVVQKSAGRTKEYADAQQNARAALDFMTAQLRAAGSDVAAYDGQGTIVHAGPHQVAFNADIDGGQVIDGEQPLSALEKSYAVPASGTPIYTPLKTYGGGAETVLFTLDSDESGVVDTGDQGDNAEENGRNTHLYVLKQYRYGMTAGANEMRDSDLAMVRGPVAYENGDNPPPLFEYYYDDDNDLATPDKLWGDDDDNLKLDSGEIGSLTDMPANLLYGIRMIKINVVSEGTQVATRDNQGFAHVVMSSRVYIRNADSRDAAHIYGTVYYDANSNGKRDSGESGLPGVVITASPIGRKTQTDNFGQYSIPVNAGTYSVKETLPNGYTATTPATVNVVITNGETINVDYGNKSGDKAGYVVGTVWDDVNKNAVNDGESGIADVVIELSNGMTGKSRAGDGYFRITAPLGSYTVTEIDPTGYSSTTANSFPVTLANDGDSVVVHFGDAIGGTEGTLQGYVYIDEDKNGIRSGSESGLPDVTLTLSNGESATTDAGGFYSFSIDPGKYDIYQLDKDGYTSTTPNIVYGITIDTGATVSQDFGDILLKDLTFVEVAIGDTQRPLSVSVGDIREDTKDDLDIVLGTPAPTNNLFVWLNSYVDGSTPLTSLFNKNPSFSRRASTDVNAVKWMERNGDGFADVLTGQEATGNNLYVWYNNPVSHEVGKSPNQIISSGSSCATTRLKTSEINGDGMRDLLVGLKSKVATFAGGFDVRVALGSGSFTSKQVVTTNGKGTALGVVTGIGVGDLDKDGDRDLAIASNNGNYWGHIDIFKNEDGDFVWQKRLLAKAGVNDVAVVDLVNDGDTYPDILVAVSEAKNVGGVQIWLNKGGDYGVEDQTGFVYDEDTEKKVPDRTYSTNGEALAVNAANLDGDIYPDVVIGTRTSSFYTGDLLVIQAIGSKTETVTNVKVNVAGEVVTIELGDMNKDSFSDVVVTTRTSASAGKLAIYFLDDPSVFP